jgi:hypothetical protein
MGTNEETMAVLIIFTGVKRVNPHRTFNHSNAHHMPFLLYLSFVSTTLIKALKNVQIYTVWTSSRENHPHIYIYIINYIYHSLLVI